jgi:hypothetical protein
VTTGASPSAARLSSSSLHEASALERNISKVAALAGDTPATAPQSNTAEMKGMTGRLPGASVGSQSFPVRHECDWMAARVHCAQEVALPEQPRRIVRASR